MLRGEGAETVWKSNNAADATLFLPSLRVFWVAGADCASKAAMDGLLHGLVCDLSQHNIQVRVYVLLSGSPLALAETAHAHDRFRGLPCSGSFAVAISALFP